MYYILKGNPNSIKRVLQENAIRVYRGEIKFIPVTEANYNVLVADDKYIAASDGKNPSMPIDEKKPKPRKKKE